MLDGFMHALAELTDNKLVAGVVPVLLGAGLLSWWFKIRDRRNAIRDESLKFVNEIADLLNKAISPLFGAVRRRSIDRLDAADKGISNLFTHRLSTRARSIALLDLPDFWREYDAITWQMRECVDSIRNASLSPPAAGNPNTSGEGSATLHWEESLETAKIIWRDSVALIEAGIDRALRGKRPTFPSRAPSSPGFQRLRNE